jgi:anti-sigma factor RsiW
MPPADPHPPEDVERYALGKLSQAEMEEFEEHLILCEQCQALLESTERLINALRRQRSKE